MSSRLLVVEDDDIIRITIIDHLNEHGWEVDEATNGLDALNMIKQNSYDLVITDIRMPKLDGEQLLTQIKQLSPSTEVILMTAHGNSENAVRCLKQGAADYLLKPFDLDDLSFRVERLIKTQEIKARCVSLESCGGVRQPLIGSSAPMQNLVSMISRVAQTDTTILIQGESGSGKELVSAAIHFESKRANKAYVRINCAAVPDGLMESIFFGHEKGAFTGASQTSQGKFELADQGTILLDEIGEMPLDLQVKLLRVLQEKEIERIGGKAPIKVDVRVICATTRNLAAEVEAGRFREDLFYRLQVIPIEVPPLRERKDDIPALTAHFLKEFGASRCLNFSLSPDAEEAFNNYSFPGNVRELRNILERVSVLAPAPQLQLWDFPPEIHNDINESEEQIESNLAAAVAKAERQCILHALKTTGGNKTVAAEILGISRKNLWEKMKLYQLQA